MTEYVCMGGVDFLAALEAERQASRPPAARPLSDWHEGIGPVLWWAFPITEPPYVGTPLDLPTGTAIARKGEAFYVENVGGWPGYHTHWTPIPIPEPPQ